MKYILKINDTEIALSSAEKVIQELKKHTPEENNAYYLFKGNLCVLGFEKHHLLLLKHYTYTKTLTKVQDYMFNNL